MPYANHNEQPMQDTIYVVSDKDTASFVLNNLINCGIDDIDVNDPAKIPIHSIISINYAHILPL